MNRRATPPTAEQELARLEALCARSEQCSYDLTVKMLRRGLSRTDAESVLESLQQRRFVDDRRFASAYASDKLRFAGWGKMKIRMGLRAKRIQDSDIDEALAIIGDDDYFAKVVSTVRTKALAIGDEIDTYEGRQRVYRQCVTRGFESALVARAMRLKPWLE